MSEALRRYEQSEWVIVVTEEYLTVVQVARLMHKRVETIRQLADREEDPIPFRIFSFQSRGPLVYKPDLYEWWHRNTVPYAGSGKSSTNDTSYKRTSHGGR